ncbi:hypothetical protein LSM04_006915 [Trypanosoma melophagium]|uniref:uncharacterized protein n=1 Tax=Trypanosoma melophagium TaxID=715481 RepID=UPI00351A2948|nr:hypothetical protein LSM04_006915 [Trypanosoma melophagium]
MITALTSVITMVMDSTSSEYFLFSLISGAGVLAGVVFGGMFVAVAVAQLIFVKTTCCFLVYLWMLMVLSLCGCAGSVALSLFGYLKCYCQDDILLAEMYAPLYDKEYKFSIGFFLICGASFLFLVAIIIQGLVRAPK